MPGYWPHVSFLNKQAWSETHTAVYSARPQKIPGWTVLVRENFLSTFAGPMYVLKNLIVNYCIITTQVNSLLSAQSDWLAWR